MSAQTLGTVDLLDLAAPTVTVAVGPSATIGDLGEIVAIFATEAFAHAAEPDWDEWLEGPDPVADVSLDAVEPDIARVYGPGDPDCPARTDFDLPPAQGYTAPADRRGTRDFHVRAGSAAQMLSEALSQATDLVASGGYAVADWIANGAPSRVTAI